MSASKPGSRAARTARQPPVIGRAVRSARWARACGRGHRRRATRLAVVSAGTVLLAAACGGGSPAASPGGSLYQQSLAYSRCMRVHGVPDFPILKQGPGGSLVHPVSPPTGMLTSPGYDAAFRACLKLTVVGGGSPARYRAIALKGLKQAECMRAHGITSFPSPGPSTAAFMSRTSRQSVSTRTRCSSRRPPGPVGWETHGRCCGGGRPG